MSTATVPRVRRSRENTRARLVEAAADVFAAKPFGAVTVDDLVGAVFATFVAVLGVAGLLIVLSTYYGPGPVPAEAGVLPQMAWVAHSGVSQALGRTDIYLTRYRLAALTTPGQRGFVPGAGESLSRNEDFARVGFARAERDLLAANPDPKVAAEALLAAALEAGGSDNVTAIVANCRLPQP